MSETRRETGSGTEGGTECEARYIYSIAKTPTRDNLGEIGIEKNAVFTIPYKDIAAVVHSCLPQAYGTKDRAIAEEWIVEHSYVIDQAMKRFGSVLPFSFDVILKGDDSVIIKWLEKNYPILHKDMENVEGKAEFGIQIYYNYDDLAGRVLEDDAELKDIKSRIEKESKGRAYLLQKKFDQKLKSMVSQKAAGLANRSLAEISSLADQMKIDDNRRKPDSYKDLSLLASLTCLVSDENVQRLGEALDEINHQKGFRVRFTGPWAPFSFVNCRELS